MNADGGRGDGSQGGGKVKVKRYELITSSLELLLVTSNY